MALFKAGPETGFDEAAVEWALSGVALPLPEELEEPLPLPFAPEFDDFESNACGEVLPDEEARDSVARSAPFG